jgi:hypothetical protein
MAGKAEQIYLHLPHIDRKETGGLRRVDQEQNTPSPADFSDRFDIGPVSGDIGNVCADDEHGFRPDPLFDIGRQNPPLHITARKAQ